MILSLSIFVPISHWKHWLVFCTKPEGELAVESYVGRRGSDVLDHDKILRSISYDLKAWMYPEHFAHKLPFKHKGD